MYLLQGAVGGALVLSATDATYCGNRDGQIVGVVPSAVPNLTSDGTSELLMGVLGATRSTHLDACSTELSGGSDVGAQPTPLN